MINIQTMRKLIGVTPQDQMELDLYRERIGAQLASIRETLLSWAQKHLARDGEALLTPAFLELLALGRAPADDTFFSIVYRQALLWRQMGLAEAQVMVLLSRLRQAFVELAESYDSPALARALCHGVDMAQTILASVFQLAHALARFKERAEFEVKRVEHMFMMIEQPPPAQLMQAYRDHQRWKQLAYEIALGMAVEASLETDPDGCELAHWLKQGGWALIPETHHARFDEAHRRVHLLGKRMLEGARQGAPEVALELIWDIEAASDEVSATLLEVMDRMFVEVATRDALTGLPNRRSFERDYHKALRMARRYGLHLGLHLLDLDHFKRINDTFGHLKGDEVLKAFTHAIVANLRDEDHLYRWGGEEFAIVTLHQHSGGAETFAGRLFDGFDGAALQAELQLSEPVTMSMATVEIAPDLAEAPSDNRVFAAADQLLYRAKDAGRNQVWAGLTDEKGYLREDTIHRVRP